MDPQNWIVRAGELFWAGPPHRVDRVLHDGDVVAGNSRLGIPNPDADTFPRRPGLGTFHGDEHADHDSIGGSDLAAVQVHDGGLSKLPKGSSPRILAGKEHRRDELHPRASPPAGSRVLRGCCLRERVVIHIRPAIRQAVASCSAGRTRRTHHSQVRTSAEPDCGLSPPAYSTRGILQIVGSSSNYSLKVRKFHCVSSIERLAVPFGDTPGWGKSLSQDTCRLAHSPELKLIDLFSLTFRKVRGSCETFVCGHSHAQYTPG